MPVTLVRQYINHRGFCQLSWVGRVLAVPGPMQNIVFRAYFTAIEPSGDHGARAMPGTPMFARDIPVGDIIDTPIGSIFHDCVLEADGANRILKTKTTSLRLDLSKNNTRVVDRWAQFATTHNNDEQSRLLLPRNSLSLPNDSDYNGMLMYIGEGDNPYAYAIPCYEVFRFFYAVSSNMAQVLLDSRFFLWNRYVWNPDRSFINREKREARLWLRQWMLDKDAWFIASLAFDEYAVNCATDIYRHLAVDERRILHVKPPMQVPINVIADWISVPNGSGTITKLITRLVSTDWRPPFDSLLYDRDNDGRQDKTEANQETPKKPINREPIPIPQQPKLEESKDPPKMVAEPSSSNRVSEEIPIQEIKDRFEWLKNAI